MTDEQSFVHSVSPFCEALQFGEAVFETLRTYHSDQVFALDEHLERLMGSVRILRLKLQSSAYNLQSSNNVGTQNFVFGEQDNFIRDCVLNLVQENKQPDKDLRIKIFLTETFFWIRTSVLEEMPESFYQEGVIVEETTFERNFPRAKYPNPAYHYLQSIRSEEAWETICFSSSGYLREGSISNIFAVFGDTVVTPDKGILLGVTRDKVLATARGLGLKAEEREISREELLEVDEIFLTCSTKEVVPVKQIQSSNNEENQESRIMNQGGLNVIWENNTFEVAHRLKEHFPRI